MKTWLCERGEEIKEQGKRCLNDHIKTNSIDNAVRNEHGGGQRFMWWHSLKIRADFQIQGVRIEVSAGGKCRRSEAWERN